MVYRKKALTVLVLKLPNGRFRITDIFGHIEEVSSEDFSKYYEAVLTEVTPPDETLKKNLEDIYTLVLSGNTEEALQLIQTLL